MLCLQTDGSRIESYSSQYLISDTILNIYIQIVSAVIIIIVIIVITVIITLWPGPIFFKFA
jgi:lipopolysaccharide/colanic/teichoic acid biosynthesis glycosyltransferase